MDSLTQMVLGAACAEAVAGKKLGNRALVWGGFAGTIPDLDVMANLFMNELDSLTFHRGPMHSMLFTTLFPFLLAALVRWLYNKNFYLNKSWRWFTFVFSLLLMVFIGVAACAITYLAAGYWVILAGIFIIFLIYAIGRKAFYGHLRNVSPIAENNYWTWAILFFVSMATHPILDSFTTYGTQLFWPFSDVRVSCSNISILDPLYTIPLLICVVACGFYDRMDRHRSIANILGLSISSVYLLFTLVNKHRVGEIFEKSFLNEGIQYSDCITTPTILNNLLWYGVARGDSVYYAGYFSLWDKEPALRYIEEIPFNNSIIDAYRGGDNFSKLRWFSDSFYNVYASDSDTLVYVDLRYGTMTLSLNNPDDFIFKFYLLGQGNDVVLLPFQGRPKQSRDQVRRFWRRVRGI